VVKQPLQETEVFLKECDLALTSDTWDVLVKFDLSSYEDVIAILHDELKGINNFTGPSLRFQEAQRVQMFLESLENKLINLKQFLPKPERRRGLLNLGGNFLKMFLGSATEADLHGLHTEVDVMRKKPGNYSALCESAIYFG